MQVKKWIIIPVGILLVCCQESTAPKHKAKDSTAIKTSDLATRDTAAISNNETAPDPEHTTLEWQVLKQYLPAIKGFDTTGNPNGENSFRGKGSKSLYYAYARQIYKKGSDDLLVEIIDYNNDQATYKGLLNMYGFVTPVNNDQVATRSVAVGVERVQALEMNYKQEQKLQWVLAVGNRFLIMIVQSGSKDHSLLSKVAQSIKLEELVGKYTNPGLTTK